MAYKPDRILLVHGHDVPRLDIRQALGQRYQFSEIHLDDLTRSGIVAPMAVIIDVPLQSPADSARLRATLSHLNSGQTSFAFIVDDISRASIVRSHALGAEFVIPRPLHPDTLYPALDLIFSKSRAMIWANHFASQARGLQAGTQALETIFQIAADGTSLTQAELYSQGDSIIETLGTSGLGQWIEAVKAHHGQTFRHSLLVTGVAVGFGQHLQMRHEDLRRLALGGLLHDLGKAAIPVEILEKPEALTKDELSVMREHPDIGRSILLKHGKFSDEMIDIVAHHHECLDGTGYPDRLSGREISDIVRIMTIADIFSALIEERPYKAPMSNENALIMLHRMQGKIDMDLLQAFEPLALQTRLAA